MAVRCPRTKYPNPVLPLRARSSSRCAQPHSSPYVAGVVRLSTGPGCCSSIAAITFAVAGEMYDGWCRVQYPSLVAGREHWTVSIVLICRR